MPRCSRRIESYQALTVRSCTSAVNLANRFHRSRMPLMPSPFFKKVEGRVGIMPSTRLGGAGTPDLWKLRSLPEFLVSRLRRDAHFEPDSPPPDPPPARTRWRASIAQCSRGIESCRSWAVRSSANFQGLGRSIPREPGGINALHRLHTRQIPERELWRRGRSGAQKGI